LSEHAVLSLEVEPKLSEDVEDHDGVVLLFGLATEDEDVIHVDEHNSFIYELSDDVIDNCLESSWAVSETKDHD